MAEQLQAPAVMVSARDLKFVKQYVDSLPEDQQNLFKERWNKIEDPAKRQQVIQKTILAYGAREHGPSLMQQAGNMIGNGAIGGPANTIGSGVTGKDIPGVIVDTANGATGGALRMADQQQGPTSLAGLSGAGVATGSNMVANTPTQIAGPMGSVVSQLQNAIKGNKQNIPFPPSEEILPSPKTLAGKIGGQTAGLVAGAGMEKLMNVPGLNKIKDPMAKFTSNSSEKAKELAQAMEYQTKEASRVSGENLAGYINANTDRLVDSKKMNEIISSMPKALREAVENSPELQKVTGVKTVTDPVGITSEVPGETAISPTLKNAEIIRRIARGDVSSRYFNRQSFPPLSPELSGADATYQEIGKLMTKGDEPLGELMKNYAETQKASKQIIPRVKSSTTGFYKPNSTTKMYSTKGTDGNIDATKVLSENNPEIIKVADEIRKLGNTVKRDEIIKKWATKIAVTASGIGAVEEAIRRAVHRG